MKKGIIVHTIIYNDKREVLIIKRASHRNVYPNLWDIPGGTLEDGEDPVVGARREILEETGLQIDNPNIFAYTSNIDREKNKQFIRLIFIGEYLGGNIKVSKKEHQDYKWIELENYSSEGLVYYLPEMIDLLKSKKHQLLSL